MRRSKPQSPFFAILTLSFAALLLLSVTAVAGEKVQVGKFLVRAGISYELCAGGSIEYDQLSVTARSRAAQGCVGTTPCFAQDSVRLTAALANFVVGLKTASWSYFSEVITLCEQQAANAVIECPPDLSFPCEEYIQQEREYIRLTCMGQFEDPPIDIEAGLEIMAALRSFLEVEATALGDGVLDNEIQLAIDIEVNIAAGGSPPLWDDGGPVPWSGPGSGGGGATPGGAQDFGYIREVVAEGYVPLPFHLATEGLFSEHDLPIESDRPCEQLLCVRAAHGTAPDFATGEMSHYVQVGFSSNIDLNSFEREPLNLAIVLDKSGSMSGPADEDLTKMEAVKQALIEIVDKLDGNDRLAIVVFDHDPHVILDSTPVADPEAIKALIENIEAGGSTNIEAGLEQGFELVAANSNQNLRLDRVMLLTDALPNVGQTGESAFLTLARNYADIGVGLSTFGVGFNFGQELVLAISAIRGGNYFFLEDADRIHEVLAEDFDYLVTPLAYEFRLNAESGLRFDVKDTFGFSGDESGPEMAVETIFLSRNRGAILFRLAEVWSIIVLE